MSPANFFITGAHGLRLVRSKYYKGFLLNSVNCFLENKTFVWNFSYGQHSWSYTSQNFCIICQSYNSSLEITKSILETCSVTLIDQCKKHKYYKYRKLTEFTDRIDSWNFHKLVSLKKGLIILQNIGIWATMSKLKQVMQWFFVYYCIDKQEVNF